MIPSFVVVLPAIADDLARACVGSMCDRLRDATLLVDNTTSGEIANEWAGRVAYAAAQGRNVGVSRAWNQGIHFADANHADYCILLSHSITFGTPGGRDFLDELDVRRPRVLMHSQYGWHLLALARATWERVGMFDTVLPIYGSDTDYLRRMHLAGLPSPRENGREVDQVNIDAECRPNGEALRRGLVDVDYSEHLRAYRAKWGGDQGQERWTCPYGREELDWTYTGKPPVGVKEIA